LTRAFLTAAALWLAHSAAYGQTPQSGSDIFRLVESINATPAATRQRWDYGLQLVGAAHAAGETVMDQEVDAIATLLKAEPRWAALALEALGVRAERALPQMKSAVMLHGGTELAFYVLPSPGKWEVICEAMAEISDETFAPCTAVIEAARDGRKRAERTRMVFDFDPADAN
jgi:hypothetical protein